MKCPKCGYLGFETGDRCRNCEYDFSLLAGSDAQPMAIDFDIPDRGGDAPGAADLLMRAEAGTGKAPPRSPVAPRRPRDSKLPLFTAPSADRQDEPLIKLPVTPRPPLAVRRTPDTPRMRVVATAVRAAGSEPALEFGESTRGAEERPRAADTAAGPPPRLAAKAGATAVADVAPLVRASAAAIDLLLLGAIDVGVVYFTLRIAGLSMSEWMVLPAVPLVCFLLVLKLAYFCAFTAVGGQTIGKMALGIRVVAEGHGSIDAGLALRRTMVGAASAAFLGLGFLVALFDPERRVLHDRVARTRVVALRPA